MPAMPPGEPAGEPFLRVVRRPEEHRPVPAGRTWSAKLSPVSKAQAMGVAALATEAGLSWLRHKIAAEDRSSRP
jgi:hypothetical protein